MLDKMTNRLDFHGNALLLRAERQRAIASNIANADTPGYVARDFNFAQAMRDATGSSAGNSAARLASGGAGASGTTDARHIPLPASGAIATGAGLQLISGKALHFMNSGYGHMERHRRRAGLLCIDLHPDDARQREVKEGDLVWVRSGGGELKAVCRVSDRVRRGVAWMPYGGLHDAEGVRRSVNLLTAEEPTDWGGGSGLYDAFVEVAAAEGLGTTERG